MNYIAKVPLSLTADKATIVSKGDATAGYHFKNAGEVITSDELIGLQYANELMVPMQSAKSVVHPSATKAILEPPHVKSVVVPDGSESTTPHNQLEAD